jgi:hypothetical protein
MFQEGEDPGKPLPDRHFPVSKPLAAESSRTKDIKPTHTPAHGSQQTGVAQHVGSGKPAFPIRQDASEVTVTGTSAEGWMESKDRKLRPSLSLGIDRPGNAAPSPHSPTP